MMIGDVKRASLPLAMLIGVGCATSAEAWAAPGKVPQAEALAPAAKHASKPAALFVPPEFHVPPLVEAKGFRLVPLGPELVTVDFDAYMSSIEHLQKTFTRSSIWPPKDISASDAMRDMETEQARFRNRQSFAYAVLTPDGRRERGSVYVSPSTVAGYDAVVRMWVTQDEYDAGFDAKLFEWVADWMQKDWPFARVAYPGRAIEWSAWDSLVAADKAKAAAGAGAN
ncbi:twin-arginine translocation pathway signal protein [Novosphingobium sp. RD2P27]|uniref:Twin-arginine translocation pathway signal protein n=1 Tax=Novosphingobium kalidii TaxID=3230299 RepID=A0ABV2D3Z6_9SPHN